MRLFCFNRMLDLREVQHLYFYVINTTTEFFRAARGYSRHAVKLCGE